MKRNETDYKTTTWHGGSTTELLIYPEDGDYETRKFIYRISKANVEKEDSHFSNLPGIDRKLMLLEGDCYLSQNKGSFQEMEAEKEYDFLGDWEVECVGKGVDFSLMLKNNAQGFIKMIKQKDEILHEPTWEEVDHIFFYAYKGDCKIQLINSMGNLKEVYLEEGESFICKNAGEMTAYEFEMMSSEAICLLCGIKL